MARTKGSKNVFKQATCDECGKLIIFTMKEDYIYTLRKEGKKKWYCSYKCWRKAGG